MQPPFFDAFREGFNVSAAGGGSGPLERGAIELPPVVVTRSEASDGPLSSELKNLGLKVILWPAIEVTESDTTQLTDALQNIGQFDWIVFASRHAVTPVLAEFTRQPANLKVAAVGTATAQVLKQRGWQVDLVPEEANAGALVTAFERLADDNARANIAAADRSQSTARESLGRAERAPLEGFRILFPASSRALPTIAKGLTALGAEVTQVEAYRTETAATLNVDECKASIDRNEIGAVTFASPSAVIELERALGREHFDKLFTSAAAVAIGPTTARVLTELGRTPVLSESATLSGLANATYRFLQTRH